MKKGPLFPKKGKRDVDHEILEAGVRMSGLQRKYRVIVERELRAIRYSRERRRDNPKAVTNLKNAYYALTVINRAQERLREITTIQELSKAMNEMGAVLKMMNRISGRAEKVDDRQIRKDLRKMDKAEGRDGTGMQNIFQAPLDTLVDDDVVERLLKGASLEECLDMEEGIQAGMEDVLPLGEEILDGLDSEEVLDQSMADIDELIKNL